MLHCVTAANPSLPPYTHTHTHTHTHTQHTDTDIQGCWGARRMLSMWHWDALEREKKKESVSHSVARHSAIPWTIARKPPVSMGFPRQEDCSELPFPSPRDLPDPGTEPRSPALQADSLPSKQPGKPCFTPHHTPGEQAPSSPAKPTSRFPCEMRI